MSEIWSEAILVGPSVTEVCVAVIEQVAHRAIISFEEDGVRLRPLEPVDDVAAPPTLLHVTPMEKLVHVRLVPDPGPVNLQELSRRLACAMLIFRSNTSIGAEGERFVHAGVEHWSYFRNGSAGEVEVCCDERSLLIAGDEREVDAERVQAALAELRAWTQERFGIDARSWSARARTPLAPSTDADVPF